MSKSKNHGIKLPPHEAGMTIGLYGGSFNPPHEGHRHVATTALKKLGLDRLWCLVTPGNPLKDNQHLPSLDARLAATTKEMDHPAIDVTGLEAIAGSNFTAQTIDWIQLRAPKIRFVWVMGADNLASFHKWQRWEDIFATLPVAIIDRPGYSLSPLSSLAAQHFAPWRQKENEAGNLAFKQSPAWVFLYGPRSTLSSTSLRPAPKQ
ncbi:MAG: nicotinate-nucleotide adenylyltransferase [Cohaesibacter sp.]|jgi:nicotinate-nucleotide adenylyltransferase|nr:nicotinate-nucleotide adenylyltransferase [Cohaesibacter sp.]